MEKLKVDEVYRLLSNILKIVADYDEEVFEATARHIESSLKGIDRDALLNVLSQLIRLKRRPIPAQAYEPEVVHKRDVAPSVTLTEEPPKGNRIKEPIVRELRAILEDSSFLESKQDLLQIIRTYFGGNVSIRPDNRDSRQDLANKAVNAFCRLTQAEQHNVYSSLRRAYLKGRKSGLGEWADIIANRKSRE